MEQCFENLGNVLVTFVISSTYSFFFLGKTVENLAEVCLNLAVVKLFPNCAGGLFKPRLFSHFSQLSTLVPVFTHPMLETIMHGGRFDFVFTSDI